MTVRPAVIRARLAHFGQALTQLERLKNMPGGTPCKPARPVGLAGLRNLLVHDYADMDPVRVWELVDTRLGDMQELHACLAALPELGTTS
jgi:uncharacterized protein with HEPN domain